jgi:hypothetical protein
MMWPNVIIGVVLCALIPSGDTLGCATDTYVLLSLRAVIVYSGGYRKPGHLCRRFGFANAHAWLAAG